MIGTIVIKAIRACNLRCPYCYYINEQTTGYGQIIKAETLEKLYSHVSEYLTGKQGFSLVWHGGEPLLLGRKRLQHFLDLQAKYFAPGQVQNFLQTNGVLINQDWIDFFRRNDIAVGISIDGSPESHDKNRITRRGAGTYSQVVQAIKLFQESGVEIGTLSVVDGNFDGRKSLRHIMDLGIPACDFLIPMTNNALQEQQSLSVYNNYTDFSKIGAFLVDAFRSWVENPSPDFTVRLFECVIRNAFGFDSGYLDAGATNLADFLVLETDGEFCLDPDFWHIDRYDLGQHYRLAFNVHEEGFSIEAAERRMDEFASTHRLNSLPGDCQHCTVRSLCRASHPASRFGSDGSFNHRSAYCEAMFALCTEVLHYIVERGYSRYLYDDDLKRHLSRQADNPVVGACHSGHGKSTEDVITELVWR